jgi:hypothetical protein
MKLLAILLLLSATAFAKTHAPLSDDLVSGKTIYIANETGSQSVLDTAYDQFTKWGRFKVISSKADADVVAVFSYESGLANGTSISFITMKVFSKSSSDAAFQTTERWALLRNGPKNCVEDFHKRLEQK